MKYCIFALVIWFNFASHAQRANTNTTVKMNTNKQLETATLANGCFWCTEAIFQRLKGVEKVESGYSGGKIANPTYKEVCSGLTGHAECIQVTFDRNQISFTELLRVFFKTHDPTTLNRQGNDIGTQYRSAIFYHSDEQKKIAEEVIDELNKSGAYHSKIVTQVAPFTAFYKAEDYHQNYFNDNKSNNPYCTFVIVPKLEKFEKVFKDKLK
jgi:peptide-methionine (S)-S-oxide reductase